MIEGKPFQKECACIAGLSLEGWLSLWQSCHVAGFSGPQRIAWPDGKSLLEQPAITIAVFDMITDQQMKSAKAGGTS